MGLYVEKHAKRNAIRHNFSPVLNQRLTSFETAQLLLDNSEWVDWNDLPVRLNFESGQTISVAWSRFDDLWISEDLSLPFDISGSEVRWSKNAISNLRPAIGQTFVSALLGPGELLLGGRDIEIWTRLVLKFDDGFLEVYNGLDENAYEYHPTISEKRFIACC